MKYYSAVLAVFKNESSFLPEWLDHYLNRGIDHIYLLNDHSTDDFYNKIEKFIDSGFVTLKNVEEKDLDKNIPWRQSYLYNKYFKETLQQTFWIGVFDLDEFFYCTRFKNINKILKFYENSSYVELLADWYWFGSNGHVEQPENIVSSFIKRGHHHSRKYNFELEGYHHEWCCKSFGKTKFITNIKHHFNEYKYLGKDNFCSEGKRGYDKFSLNLSGLNLAHINHYVGSKNYYMSKKNRGSCNNSNIIRDEKMYNLLNMNHIIDTRLMEQKNANR